MDKTFYLILGMHRSGTSCLAGALERCGMYLGKVSRKGKYNKKGNHEKKEIFYIHDQILALNKGSWQNPPSNQILVHDYHHHMLQEIVNNLRKKDKCGLKDPRTLLLIDSWKKILYTNYQLIGTFRHPMAVAQSLKHRNNMSIEKGLELWQIYNKELVKTHKQESFPLIHYDLSNMVLYLNKITTIAKAIGLKPNYLKMRFFISKKLEHHSLGIDDVPNSCKDIYSYLLNNVA